MTPDQSHRHPRIASQAMAESVPADTTPAEPPSITCPRCGRTSWNPNDVRHGYCGACHDWTSPAPYVEHGHCSACGCRAIRSLATDYWWHHGEPCPNRSVFLYRPVAVEDGTMRALTNAELPARFLPDGAEGR